DAAHHALPPPVLDDAWYGLRTRSVETVEWARREIDVKLRTVVRERGSQSVEDLDRKSTRIVPCLHHNRRHRADKNELDSVSLAMASDVASSFSAACGVSDMDAAGEAEMFDHRGRVGGVVVHVVTIAHLRGTA